VSALSEGVVRAGEIVCREKEGDIMKTTLLAAVLLLTVSHEAFAQRFGTLVSLGGSRISPGYGLTVIDRLDSDGAFKLDIYGLDATGEMVAGIMTESNRSFSGFGFTSGTVQSDVSAVGWQRHREVFAMKNSLIYHQSSDDNSSWTAWQVVPGQLEYICSAPSAVSWTPGRIDVFVMGCEYGSGGVLVHGWTAGGNNWAWESLGGAIYSRPSAISTGNGLLDVFVKGGSNTLWDDQWRNGWTWLQTPLTTTYPPVGLVEGSGAFNPRPFVCSHSATANQFGETGDDNNGNAWLTPHYSASVSTYSVPHGTKMYKGGFPNFYVYYLVNNVIKRQAFDNTFGWSQPSLNFDSYTVDSDPIPVASAVPSFDGIFVFALGFDGNIYYGLDIYN
jgi:hypothetical protein